jgi:hypothetical protein
MKPTWAESSMRALYTQNAASSPKNTESRIRSEAAEVSNLAGLQAEGAMFQAAVTDAVGHIVKQTSEQPPKYLVKLLFSFRGVSEVEVPAYRIHGDK